MLRLLLYAVVLAAAVPAIADAGVEEIPTLFGWTLLLGGGALLAFFLLPRLRKVGEHRWVRRADLAAFNLLLTLFLLESALLAARAAYPGYVLWDEAPDALRVALARGEESNPHFDYKWNSRRFHDEEFFTARPGDHTVALLADSFGVGIVPYPYNFVTVAERRLGELLKGRVPGRVALHNLGVTRIGMAGYAYLLRTEVPRLKVAQVVLAIFTGNDIHGFPEPARSPGFIKMHLSLRGWLLWRAPRRAWKIHKALGQDDEEESSMPRGGGDPLACISHQGAVARQSGPRSSGYATVNAYWLYGEPARRRCPDGSGCRSRQIGEKCGLAYLANPELEQPFFGKDQFLAIERSRLALLDPAAPMTMRRYERFLKALGHFHRELDRQLLVMLIPDELQVNNRLWAELGGGTADTAHLQREYPQRRITAWCAKQGIRVLDLLPLLRRAEQSGRTFHLRDTHFNARGNRVVGEALAAELSRYQPVSLK